jgi:hypothetical protein
MAIDAPARLGDPAVPRPRGAVRASRVQAGRPALGSGPVQEGRPVLGSRRVPGSRRAPGDRPVQASRRALGDRRAQASRRAQEAHPGLGVRRDVRRGPPVGSAPVGRQAVRVDRLAVRVARRAVLDPGTPGMRVPGPGTHGRGARRRAAARTAMIVDLDVSLVGVTGRQARQVPVASPARGRRIRRSLRAYRPATWIG